MRRCHNGRVKPRNELSDEYLGVHDPESAGRRAIEELGLLDFLVIPQKRCALRQHWNGLRRLFHPATLQCRYPIPGAGRQPIYSTALRQMIAIHVFAESTPVASCMSDFGAGYRSSGFCAAHSPMSHLSVSRTANYKIQAQRSTRSGSHVPFPTDGGDHRSDVKMEASASIDAVICAAERAGNSMIGCCFFYSREDFRGHMFGNSCIYTAVHAA